MKKEYLYIIGLVVGFVLIKSLFKNPFAKSEEEKKADKKTKADLENPYSPLSPLYLKSQTNLFNLGKVKGVKLLTQKEAQKRANKVYQAKGFIKDTDELAMGALGLEYKTQVSQVASKFEQLYDRSMHDYLAGFMDSKTFNTLVERVSKLK